MEKKKLKCIQVYPLKLTTLLITEFQSSQELTTTTSWIQGKFPIKIWGLSWRTAWIWRGCSCWKTAATSSPTPTTSPSINEMLKGYFFQKLVELNELRNGNFQGWFSRCIFEVVIKYAKIKKKYFKCFKLKIFSSKSSSTSIGWQPWHIRLLTNIRFHCIKYHFRICWFVLLIVHILSSTHRVQTFL